MERAGEQENKADEADSRCASRAFYLLVVVLCPPSGRFWAAAACSEPVGFPTPQGRRATGPRGDRATESKYSSWCIPFLSPSRQREAGPGRSCSAAPDLGGAKGVLVYFQQPKGHWGLFKFGGSPPSRPWVIAKQRQVGPEYAWNNQADGPAMGLAAMGHTTAGSPAAVPPEKCCCCCCGSNQQWRRARPVRVACQARG